MSLADIVRGNWLKDFATATDATDATDGQETAPTVASVASVAVATPPEPKVKSQDDPFAARLALFIARGLSAQDSEAMAEKLTERDLDRDDRRLCLECLHLSGRPEARLCAKWREQGITSPAIPSELATILQRCSWFTTLEATA